MARPVDKNDVPAVTVPRLALYLRKLRELQARGVERVSRRSSPSMIDLNAAQIRKDFSYFGEFGTRGVGYEVDAAGRRDQALPRPRPLVERDHRRRRLAGHGAGPLPRLRRAGLPAWSPCSTASRKEIGASFGDGRACASVADLERVLPRGARRHRHRRRAGRTPQSRSSTACRLDRPARAAPSSTSRRSRSSRRATSIVRQVDFSSELMFLSFYLDREA